MNKCFKTVYNAARKCIVVVNETVSAAAQSTGVASECKAPSPETKSLASTPRISYKRTALSLVVGAVLCLQFGIASAAYNLTVNEEETQTISDPDLIIANTGEEGTVESRGTLTIQSGSSSKAYGINTNASDGGTGIIENSGTAESVLTIKGGSYRASSAENGAHGIYINADANSQGSIINSGAGTLNIEGGTGNYAYGIYANASGKGAHGTISNTGSGNLTIKNGSSTYNLYGIYYNAVNGGIGNIINKGNGTLNIGGGSGRVIYYNAFGSGSTGTISNTGSGALMIQNGDSSYADCIYYNAYGSGSTGIISNSGTGDLTIRGGTGSRAYGIYYNAYNGGTANIINEGSGELKIHNSIRYGASGEGSTSTISNVGNGTLTIEGTGSNSYGIETVAAQGAVGEISNTGTGSLIIRTGSNNGRGIQTNAASGSTVTISNDGSGELIIQSEVYGGYGISFFSSGEGSTGILRNGVNGTLKIFGNARHAICNGIHYLASSGGTAVFENAGTLYLNEGAIGRFIYGSGTASFTNKSTGKVFAEAKAIFDGSVKIVEGDPIIKPVDVVIWNGERTKIIQSDLYTTTKPGRPVDTTGNVYFRDNNDWKNYSHWEAGGQITFVDVVAGSSVAKQITLAFRETFGTGTTIRFTGTGFNSGEDQPSNTDDFNLDVVNDLISTGKLTDGSVVTSESLNMANSALTVGAADTDTFKQNIGFKGVEDASSITVKDGKQLTLMGSQAAMAVALRTMDAEANALPVITDAAVDLKNGTLRVGIDALSTTQGSFTNTVTADAQSTVNVENAVVHFAGVQGDGALKVGEKSTVTVDSTDVKTIGNKGVLTTKDIAGSTQITNEGTATFGNVTLQQQGNIANYKDASITAGNVTVGVGAFLTNATGGTFTFDSMTMNGTLRNNGTLQNKKELLLAASGTTQLNGSIKGNRLVFGAAQKTLARALAQPATNSDADGTYEVNGEIFQKELEFNSGVVNVNKDATLAGEELAGGIVNSAVTVDADGTFAFSFNENQLKDALKELKVSTDGKAVAVLSESLSFGETGSLTIGTATGGGTLNLGSDALLYYTGDAMNADDSVTLKVDEGATAVFAKTDGWGRYYLMTGLDADSMTEAGKLAVVDKDGEAVKTAVSDKGLYVQQGTMNILDKDASYGLSNNINSILDGEQNAASEFADVAFLSKAVSAKNGADAANRLEQVASEAGSMAETARQAVRAQDAVAMRALTMPASGLWAELVTGKFEADGFDAGKTSSGYEADTYGIMAGLDVAVGQSWTFGAAFNYAESDIEASSSDTKNDFESYGFSLYAGKAFESGLRLSASVGYSKGSSEVTQKNLSLVKADIDTSAWVVGARAAYTLGMSKHSAITPYIGVDAVWLKQDAFTAKLNGADAFDYASADETFVRLPVGVRADWAARTNETTAWSAFADLSVAPQFGGTEADAEVTGVHTHATDSSSFTYADDYVASLKLGGSVRMNRVNLELDYGASMGDVREISHEFSAKAKFVF